MKCSTSPNATKKNAFTACYKNIHGEEITCSIKTSSSQLLCQEIAIDSPPFRIKPWLSLTAIFTAIFLHCGVHTKDSTSLSFISLILLLTLISKAHNKVRRESVLVITSLGMQLTTTFVFGRQISQFIAWENVKDVVINEAVTMHQVLFYLVVLLQKNDKLTLIPLFQSSFPRLNCLERIYQHIQPTLAR